MMAATGVCPCAIPAVATDGRGYFASAQLGPKPMSTVSGTRSSVTLLHHVAHHRLGVGVLADSGTSSTSSSCTVSSMRGVEPASSSAAVEVDHRQLEDVGGRALHRRVLRHALAHLADAEVVGRQLA